ncbi:MAG TPA: HupE/UreJ family protein [Thermoanaerobaculia bacterium]|nr:HupE/UreJ family protein [Thermoanaerobaculia bacterium]
MPRRSHLLTFAVLLALVVPAARAHELGKVQVYATFLKDGTYRIELVADEEHLTSKDVGGPAGETRYGPIRGISGEVDRRFGRFFRSLVDGAAIGFDGRPVRPVVEMAPPDPEAPPGRMTLLLHGPIPGGAHTFTWSETAGLGSYPLIPQSEGDESAAWQWLDGNAASQPFRLAAAVVPPTRLEIIGQYLRLGFTHILPKGLDHILFVLGLFLLSRRVKPLLLQVTSFTIAHTVTLALSIYGVFSLPASIVEPLIALSIVFVAVENVFTSELRPSRVALVFAFGLLHGLGFAGVLSQLGLPRAEFLPALLSFNVGVEAGQLAVISLALLAVGLFRQRSWYRSAVVVPASLLIAAVGLYWSVQRVFF